MLKIVCDRCGKLEDVAFSRKMQVSTYYVDSCGDLVASSPHRQYNLCLDCTADVAVFVKIGKPKEAEE